MKTVLILTMSSVSAGFGQIFFKKGLLVTGEVTFTNSIVGDMLKIIFNPIVFSGLILYLISTILWLIGLSKETLNYAYPFAALTFVVVILSSRIIFLEDIPTLRYVGISFICLGFLLCSLAKG